MRSYAQASDAWQADVLSGFCSSNGWVKDQLSEVYAVLQ